ncbi:MAG: YihA family ribosome biogenesis GTP-binding protein [Clostridia bacterium]|nr:YihA family ribosome biogenesis GTP-binding protein [Clostridia bacterium]
MKIKNSSFVTSAVKEEQYPEELLPEIAFAGRSNVGKSSLINMLINRKGLAKTSSTPGKTQLVNFYDIDGLFRMVDLPGYGYAKVSKSKKSEWGTIIDTYLSSRKNLIEVLLLVDCRHKPTEDDREMYQWIKAYGYNGIVVATKADKLSQNQLAKQLPIIRTELKMTMDDMLVPVSSEKRSGKYEVWDLFNQLFMVNGYDIAFERQTDGDEEILEAGEAPLEASLLENNPEKKPAVMANAPKKKDRKRNRPEEKDKLKKKKQQEAKKKKSKKK